MTNTPYHIKISPAARRQMLALPHKQQKAMLRFIEALAINPRPPGVNKVDGLIGLYREEVETEHLRLIYKVEEQEVLLLLIK